MIISIAWRNLWRHKLRSAIVMLAVTIGLAAGLFSVGFMVGMFEERIESTIGSQIANIQIHNSQFIEEDDFSFMIDNGDEIIGYLVNEHNIDRISSRILAEGMITSPTNASGVKITAVDIDDEKKVSNLYARITEGEYLPEDVRNPIYISERLANELSVSIRSRIVINFQDPQGHITGGAFRVAGTFRTENSNFDNTNVFIRKDDLIRISSHELQDIHEIAVRFDDDNLTSGIVSGLNEKFQDTGIKARSWHAIQPELGMIIEMLNQMMYILMAIILFALAFTIINTMLMAVMERYHEFGVLMAVGMKKSRVFIMVMAEALFLSLTGAIIGMIISYFTILYTSSKGIDISAVAEGLEAVGYSAVIYPSLSISFYIGITFLVILTSIISAIYPAVKALKLNPAEAVRIQ